MARMVGTKELQLSWLYDHTILPMAVAQTQITLFQVPTGNVMPATAIRKSYRHTNLTTQGFLGSIKTFTITSLYIAPPPFLASGEVDNFVDGYGVFWINEKPYPDYFFLNMFVGGPQWRESVRGPAAGPEFRAFTGDGRVDNRVFFKAPYLVTIDSFENFRAEINWTSPGYTPSETILLGMVLFGRLERAVA